MVEAIPAFPHKYYIFTDINLPENTSVRLSLFRNDDEHNVSF